MNELTPIENINGIYIKREDLFEVAGVKGGKARTCWFLSQNAKGLVTAGSRKSPQIKIVAYIANYLKIPCYAHSPSGELGNELLAAKEKGANIVQHKAGYNSVIIKRAKEQSKELNLTYIPFGMECQEAVEQTSKQVLNIPKEVKRIVISVGSGMSLCGILKGLADNKLDVPVLGVVVGANPIKRLNTFFPSWKYMVKLEYIEIDYHKEVNAKIGDLELDPIYEAKCLPFLEQNDLFWIIGNRK